MNRILQTIEWTIAWALTILIGGVLPALILISLWFYAADWVRALGGAR